MPNFFMIPIDKVPTSPTFTVHYGTWTSPGLVTWSLYPPSPMPNMETSFVCCVATEGNPPEGVIPLGSGSKDLPPPPSQLGTVTDLDSFEDAMKAWVIARVP